MSEEARLFLREINGQLCVSVYGSDDAGNLDSQRTDANRIPWRRDYREPILQNGVLLDVAATTVYSCPASTITEEIYVEVVNNEALPCTVTLYVDYDGAAVTQTEMILNTYTMAAFAIPVRLGPYSLQAGGTVRGLCSIASSVTARVFGWRRPTPP